MSTGEIVRQAHVQRPWKPLMTSTDILFIYSESCHDWWIMWLIFQVSRTDRQGLGLPWIASCCAPTKQQRHTRKARRNEKCWLGRAGRCHSSRALLQMSLSAPVITSRLGWMTVAVPKLPSDKRSLIHSLANAMMTDNILWLLVQCQIYWLLSRIHYRYKTLVFACIDRMYRDFLVHTYNLYIDAVLHKYKSHPHSSFHSFSLRRTEPPFNKVLTAAVAGGSVISLSPSQCQWIYLL